MQKLSHLAGAEWLPYSYPPHFELPQAGARSQRLVAGVPGGDPAAFTRLVGCLEPPYLLLYVLHTPRGEGEAGRYQSPELSARQFTAFVERFQPFFSADARFDLWVHSPAEQATVVWDRHDQLFAYGPLERFAAELIALGFQPGSVKAPDPHQHHYRPECDALAKKLVEEYPWSVSPLRPEDEQLRGGEPMVNVTVH